MFNLLVNYFILSLLNKSCFLFTIALLFRSLDLFFSCISRKIYLKKNFVEFIFLLNQYAVNFCDKLIHLKHIK